MKTLVATLLIALLAGCATPPPSGPQYDHTYTARGQSSRVRFLVLHYTDEDFARSLDLLTRRHDNPVSAHYLVTRAGEHGRGAAVLRLVDEARRAWHAGPSRWQGHEPLNGESIGIEIVYESHCARAPRPPGASPWAAEADCAYPQFPADQIAAVIRLAQDVLRRHPQIDPTRVVGHADVQPENKTDPGPRFPWRALAAAGVGAWFDDADVAYYRARFDAAPPEPALVLQALAAWGYGLQAYASGELPAGDVVRAFQCHFLPQHRSGSLDADTAATVFALLARYRRDELERLGTRWPQLPAPPPARQRFSMTLR